MAHIRHIEWTKKSAVVLRIVTLSIMDQFKEIPLLESLLNFEQDVFYQLNVNCSMQLTHYAGQD